MKIIDLFFNFCALAIGILAMILAIFTSYKIGNGLNIFNNIYVSIMFTSGYFALALPIKTICVKE